MVVDLKLEIGEVNSFDNVGVESDSKNDNFNDKDFELEKYEDNYSKDNV